VWRWEAFSLFNYIPTIAVGVICLICAASGFRSSDGLLLLLGVSEFLTAALLVAVPFFSLAGRGEDSTLRISLFFVAGLSLWSACKGNFSRWLRLGTTDGLGENFDLSAAMSKLSSKVSDPSNEPNRPLQVQVIRDAPFAVAVRQERPYVVWLQQDRAIGVSKALDDYFVFNKADLKPEQAANEVILKTGELLKLDEAAVRRIDQWRAVDKSATA
jgi:hypothetical protein